MKFMFKSIAKGLYLFFTGCTWLIISPLYPKAFLWGAIEIKKLQLLAIEVEKHYDKDLK